MTLDYICHLTKEEVKHPARSEQWASQYYWLVATGKKGQADSLREKWKDQYTKDRRAPGEVVADREWQNILGLSPETKMLPMLADLPDSSFIIRFTFKLQKPYLSKDANDFHIIDNPLVRETVFRWPMVCPSSWKGSLRHALWQLGRQEDDEQIRRIFGEIRSDDSGQAGRLHLYPTFFERSSLEIINPHDRERRVGKNPILIECVPPKIAGDFFMLYTPFDCIGGDKQKAHKQVAEDLEVLALGIQAMLTTHGFGAKTSSGFGTAEDRLASKGALALRAELPDFDASPKPAVSGIGRAQAEIAQFVARHSLQEFPRWTKKELEQSNWGAKKQSEYKRLRKRHPDWDDQANAWRVPVEEAAPALSQMPTVTTVEFETLSELRELAQRVAMHLRNGGEA